MSQQSVLIVDDKKSLAENYRIMFCREGWQAEAVFSGLEAIEKVCNREYDAILLDMRMPGMDGFETLKRIRDIRHDACILFLTAYGEVDTAVRALREGAINLLLKPVSFQYLRAMVEDGIQRHKYERDARDKEHAEQEAARTQAILNLSLGMAHSIKNGLSALGIRHELIMGDACDADRTRHLNEANEVLDTMDSAVRHLYQYAKAEKVQLGRVALRSSVNTAIECVRKRRCRNHGELAANLIVDVPDLMIEGEAEIITEAVVCLIDNALDASPKGNVHVSAVPQNEFIDLTVSDDGDGFAQELLGKAHHPFQTSRQPTHIGFGLAFVDQVARCCKGTLKYGNVTGGSGAFVTLSLRQLSLNHDTPEQSGGIIHVRQ